MIESRRHSQTEKSVEKNSQFFLDHNDAYSESIAHLDTYQAIFRAVTEAVRGTDILLDVGNGGVFDYDTSVAGRITGIDLFLDRLPAGRVYPENVTMEKGDALHLPKPDASQDGVLMVMLLHHLIGRTWRECVAILDQAIAEAARVLRPGGKLIIVESCVPPWFFQFEKVVFRASSMVINSVLAHPPTFQHTIKGISETIQSHFSSQPTVTRIPKGSFVIQYGFKVPSLLTPVQPVLFVIRKK
jgi:ubiquinone/menaquinone biosynthesis C-methylase UbiE